MKVRQLISGLCSGVAFALLLIPPEIKADSTQKYKVLVVMSYEQDNPWVIEIQTGMERVLGTTSNISYVYMDTKIDADGGPAKAAKAYDLFTKLHPDGVLAFDDNAQSMFVVPYLMGKTDVPVMFGGVNAAASKYGYPAKNISGILERAHVRETVAYLQQLDPGIRSISFVVRNCSSGKALRAQVEAEVEDYTAQVSGFHLIKSMAELRALGEKLRKKTDAIFIESLEGLTDEDGKAQMNKPLYDVLFDAFQGPIIGANRYHVQHGVLTAVAKTGEEQGHAAAEMLLQAMRGTPVTDIPVVKNNRGRRIINVATMKKLNMKPRPIDLRGATLVNTQE